MYVVLCFKVLFLVVNGRLRGYLFNYSLSKVNDIAELTESCDSNDTGACRLHNRCLHNRSMAKRVLRLERHEGVSSPQSLSPQS